MAHTGAQMHQKKRKPQSIKTQTKKKKKIIEPVAIETICSPDGKKEGKFQAWSEVTRERDVQMHMHSQPCLSVPGQRCQRGHTPVMSVCWTVSVVNAQGRVIVLLSDYLVFS